MILRLVKLVENEVAVNARRQKGMSRNADSEDCGRMENPPDVWAGLHAPSCTQKFRVSKCTHLLMSLMKPLMIG